MLFSLNLWMLFSGKSTTGFIYEHASFLYVLLAILYFGISFTMAFLPCSNFHHPVICRGRTDGNKIALTFDDGPDKVKTPLVLEILDKYNVPATFFCIGKNIAGNEHLLIKIHESGHLIGNHSFSHSRWFDLFSAGRIKSELLESNRLIKQATGLAPHFFRPPFGVINPMVSKALKKTLLQTVCWNIRSFDTLNRNPGKVNHNILRQLRPGSIILLHDHTLFTEHSLDKLISDILGAGFYIVPLDNLLQIPAYEP